MEWEHSVKLRNIGLLITSLFLIYNIGILHLILIVLMREIQLKKIFFKFELPSSHNYSKQSKITHIWFKFFSHPFHMGILCMERHVHVRWMYLNRSIRKLEWQHSVKLRNIALLITSFVILSIWGYYPRRDIYKWS